MVNLTMLRLLIARHGNTFDSGDIIRRVGLRTNLPLSVSGLQQSEKLGNFLLASYPTIEKAYCSELIRTRKTAEIILSNYPNYNNILIEETSLLNEIDYGEDDGQIETMVLDRIGKKAMDDWENSNIVPKGWLFDSEQAIKDIKFFTNSLVKYDNKTILIVTSNGIARFFPHILNDSASFMANNNLKMPTASISEIVYTKAHGWNCNYWGKKIS